MLDTSSIDLLNPGLYVCKAFEMVEIEIRIQSFQGGGESKGTRSVKRWTDSLGQGKDDLRV